MKGFRQGVGGTSPWRNHSRKKETGPDRGPTPPLSWEGSFYAMSLVNGLVI